MYLQCINSDTTFFFYQVPLLLYTYIINLLFPFVFERWNSFNIDQKGYGFCKWDDLLMNQIFKRIKYRYIKRNCVTRIHKLAYKLPMMLFCKDVSRSTVQKSTITTGKMEVKSKRMHSIFLLVIITFLAHIHHLLKIYLQIMKMSCT